MSSSNIDDRIVAMRFDNQQFEKGIGESLETLETFKKSLDMEKAARSFNDGMDDVIKSAEDLNKKFKFDSAVESFGEIEEASKKVKFDVLNGALEAVQEKFSFLGTIADQVFRHIGDLVWDATSKISGLVKELSFGNIGEGWKRYENELGYVQQIMNATGMSEDAIYDKVIDKIDQFSDETSYSSNTILDMVSAVSTLGYSLEEATNLAEGLAIAIAYNGKGTAAFNSVSQYGLKQALQLGAMTSKDWQSFETAGVVSEELINSLIRAGEEAGTIKKGQVTIANFRDSLSAKETKHWLNNDVMIKAFSEWNRQMSKALELVNTEGNDIEYASQALSILGEECNDFSQKGAVAAQTAKTFSESIDAVKDAVATGWKESFRLLIGQYSDTKVTFSWLTEELLDIFTAAGTERNRILQEWSDEGGRYDLDRGLVAIWENIKAIVESIKGGIAEVFPGLSGKDLADLTEKFADLMEDLALSEDTLDDIKTIVGGIASIFKMIFDTIGAIVKPLLGISDDVANTAGSVLDVVISILAKIADKITKFANSDAFKAFTTVLTNIGTFIHDVFADVLGIIADVFDNFGEFGGMFGNLDGVLKVGAGALSIIQNLVLYLIDLFGKFTGIDMSDFKTNVSDLFYKFAGILENVWNILKKVKDDLVTFFINIFGTVKSFFEIKGDHLFEGLNDVGFDGLAKVIQFLINAFEDLTGLDLSKFSENVTDKLEKVRTAFSKALGVVDIFFGRFKDSVKLRIPNFFADLSDVFNGVSYYENGEGLSGVTGSIADGMLSVAKVLIQMFGDVTGLDISWLEDKFVPTWHKVRDALVDFAEKVEVAWENLKKALSPIFDWLSDKFKTIKEKVKDMFGLGGVELDLDASPLEFFMLGGSSEDVDKDANVFTRIARRLGELRRRGEGLGMGPVGNGPRDSEGGILGMSGEDMESEIEEQCRGIERAFQWLGELFDRIKADLGPKLEEFKQWFYDKFGSLFESGAEFYDKVKEKFQPLIDFLWAAWDLIKTIWKDYLKPLIDEILEWATEKMKELKEKIENSDIDFGDMLKGGGILAIIGLLFKRLTEWNPGEGGFFSSGGIMDNVCAGLHTFSDTMEELQTKLRANAVKDLAIAIGIIAASLIGLSLIDVESLNSAIFGLSSILGAMEALMGTMGSIVGSTTFNEQSAGFGKGNGKTFVAMGAALLEMSIGVAVLAGALAVVAQIPNVENLTDYSLLITELAGTLLLSMLGMSQIAGNVKTTALVGAGFTMILAAKAITMMTKPMKIIADIPKDKYEQAREGILIVSGCLAGIFLALSQLNESKAKKGNNNIIIKVAASILMVAAAMALVAAAIAVIARVAVKNPTGFNTAVIALVGALVTIALVITALALVSNKLGDTNAMIKSAGAIAIVALALVAIAGAIGVLAQGLAGADSASVVAAIVIFAAILIAIGGVLGGLAIIAKQIGDVNSIIKTAIAIGIVALSLIGVAGAIAMLAEYKWDGLLVATASLVLVLGGIVAAFILLEKFGGSATSMVATAGAMALACASILLIAVSISMVANYDWVNILVAMVAIGGVFAAMAIALGVLSKNTNGADLAGTAASMLLASAAILAIGAALSLVAQYDWESIAAAGIALGGILVIMAAALGLLAYYFNTEELLAAGGAIALVGAALLMAAEGFKIVCDGIEQLINLGPQGLEVIKELGDYMISRIPDVIEGLAEGLLVRVPKVLIEAIPVLTQALIELTIALLDVFVTTLPEAIKAIWAFIWAILDSVLENIKQIVITIGKILIAIIEGLIEIIGPLVVALIQLVCKIIEAVGSQLSLIVQTLVQLVIDLINAIADAIENKALGLYEALKHLISSIFKAIVKISLAMIEDIKDLAKKLIDSGFIQGVADKINAIRDKANELWNNFLDALAGKIVEAVQWGRNVVQGIINGITEMFGPIVSKVQELWGKISGTYTDASKTESPSKVAIGWGQFLVDGLVIGIDNKLGEAENASNDLASAVLDPMTQAMAMAAQIVDEEDFDPVITPVLDLSEIQNGVGYLGNMLNDQTLNIAGRANLGESRTNNFMNDVVGRLNDLSASQGNNSYSISISINPQNGQNAKEIAEEVERRLTMSLNQRGYAFR